MNLIAYRRVSTETQHASGLGLEAQTAAVERYASEHGHTIAQWHEDVASGAKADRQGFQLAMTALHAREADGLIVAKLDRMSRSSTQVLQILDAAKREGWALIMLDLGIDTSTPTGRYAATILGAGAQLERDMASVRTREACEARRIRLGGKLPGTRPSVPETVRVRVYELRDEGRTLKEIANLLTVEGARTAQGGQWHPSTVKHLLDKATAA